MTARARGPRRLVHRGVVDAAGVFFDAALLGDAGARARALAAWEPGAGVFRGPDGGVVVRFRAPRRIACARAPGTPLVALDDATAGAGAAVLYAAPLSADERAALAAPPGSAVLVRGGAAVVVALDARAALEPSAWLELPAFDVLDVAPLGAPPAPPGLAAGAAGAPGGASLRGLFGSTVGGAAPGLAAVLAALRGADDGAKPEGAPETRDGAEPEGAEPGRPAAPRRRRGFATAFFATLTAALSAIFARMAGAFERLGARRRASPRAPYRTPEAPVRVPPPRANAPEPAAAAAPSGPGAFERLGARLRNLAARMLAASRLAALLGRRQAEYVGKMMEMFQNGDLERALRHAIPLGGEGGDSAPALGVPRARGDLAISPRERRGGGGALLFGPDLYEQLRKMYRAAFERLAADGKIEQAAFVLAELLREHEEAVAFLERHGRHRLAAEIAEARNLPPGLVVRQWFLAGEPARAVRAARRAGAFADAVLRLRASDPARADELQVLWARSLADAGDYVAAVETAWPVASARTEAAGWIDAAIARGGVAAAAMLVRKLELDPAAFSDVLARVRALCDDDAAEREPERRALGELLVATARTPATATVALPVVRAVLRDAARGGAAATIALARNLVAVTDDAALRADLVVAAAQAAPSLAARETPLLHAFGPDDVGAIAAWDAARAADGRTVVALGEAGVRVLHRDGRVLFHLDEPAHRLVISDHGDRALALARRGAAWRIARLDLVNRRAAVWSEARLDGFAPDFDGSVWVVGAGADLLVMDATAEGFEVLRRFRDLDGRVVAVARAASGCAALTAAEDGSVERWHFALPAWSLRARANAPVGGVAAADPARRAVASDGGVAAVWDQVARGPGLAPPRLQLALFDEQLGNRAQIDIGEPGDAACDAAATPAWAAVALRGEGCVRVEAATRRPARVRLRVELAQATRATVRLTGELLVVADDRGRVLAFDLATGERVRNARM